MRCVLFDVYISMVQKLRKPPRMPRTTNLSQRHVLLPPKFHKFQGAHFAPIESKVGHVRLNFGMSTQLQLIFTYRSRVRI